MYMWYARAAQLQRIDERACSNSLCSPRLHSKTQLTVLVAGAAPGRRSDTERFWNDADCRWTLFDLWLWTTNWYVPNAQPDAPAQGNSFRQALWIVWGACKHWQLGWGKQMDVVAALLTPKFSMLQGKGFA